MERFKKLLPILIILIIMVSIILIVFSLRKNKKSELDIFYSDEITSDYEDIRKLSANYNIYDAQTDKCFIVGAMVHNENVYGEFVDNFENGRDAFVRIARNTENKDLVLFDIMYKSSTKEFKLVTDYTRDASKNKEDRIIKLSNYKNISEYKYKESTYLVLYNGELNDETFNSENVFKVVTLY